MPKQSVISPFPGRRHNHKRCVQSAMQEAEATCKQAGLRLTHIRKQVLALVWNNHAPVKAYEILEHMHKENPKAAPPTVYRALEFLQAAGLVHRIESLNAYVGCGAPGQPHVGQFLICVDCGDVAEIHEPGINRLLQRHAENLGFHAAQPLVEIKGHCPACRSRWKNQ